MCCTLYITFASGKPKSAFRYEACFDDNKPIWETVFRHYWKRHTRTSNGYLKHWRNICRFANSKLIKAVNSL